MNNNGNVFVLGSFMMDLIVKTSVYPRKGETVIGKGFYQYPGGKGANQAVSAARQGANVTMAGKVGMDDYGEIFKKVLSEEKIDSTFVLTDKNYATGIGSVVLEERGENRIIIVPGANMHYLKKDFSNTEKALSKANILLLQLEMNLGLIEEAVNKAYELNIPVILNPAPANYLKEEVLRKVTYLTPNETETELLTGLSIDNLQDAELAGKALLQQGVKNVIITLGSQGALLVNTDGVKHIPSHKVNPIDTTGAGDAFNGALAASLASGNSLEYSVDHASIVGSLTVTKEGAIPSIPKVKEVKTFRNSVS